MVHSRVVASLTLVAFVIATTGPAIAAPGGDPAVSASSPAAPPVSPLRASIERAGATAALDSAFPRVPERRPAQPRKFVQGGGGGGMMVMTLLVTAASLAGTYFLVKEMRKSTEEAATAAR